MNPEEIQRELENLTPGGSEFYNNPKMCLSYLKDRRNTTLYFVKEKKRLEIENIELRKMLAFANTGAKLYGDDGELQDNSIFPFIDYKRDSVELIKQKIYRRNMNDPKVQEYLETLREVSNEPK
jgi:hypothetical protein